MASFNSINDDCAELILIRIALSSRISLRVICKRWKSLIDSLCLKVRKLSLVGPTEYPGQEEPGPFPSEYFIKYLSNVTHLDIEIRRFSPLQFCLASILQCWTSTLTHLSIDNLPVQVPGSLLNSREWAQLNKMTKLESLHLSDMRQHQVAHPKYLAFIRQLKCLSFEGYNAAHLIPLIYSLGSELRDLNLQIKYDSEDDVDRFDLYILDEVLDDNREMTSGVTRLKIDHPCKNDIESKSQFGEMICAYFCSVTELDFVPVIPMELMLPHLASLSNLTKLRLSLHKQTDFNSFPSDCIIESVKFLSLDVSHFYAKKLINMMNQLCAVIPTTFPSLEELRIVVDARLWDFVEEADEDDSFAVEDEGDCEEEDEFEVEDGDEEDKYEVDSNVADEEVGDDEEKVDDDDDGSAHEEEEKDGYEIGNDDDIGADYDEKEELEEEEEEQEEEVEQEKEDEDEQEEEEPNEFIYDDIMDKLREMAANTSFCKVTIEADLKKLSELKCIKERLARQYPIKGSWLRVLTVTVFNMVNLKK